VRYESGSILLALHERLMGICGRWRVGALDPRVNPSASGTDGDIEKDEQGDEQYRRSGQAFKQCHIPGCWVDDSSLNLPRKNNKREMAPALDKKLKRVITIQKGNRMKITYYGHSCFLAEIDGQKLLFDPFITQNPLAGSVDINNIKADYILVSHAHDDHMADAAILSRLTGATIISNFEITEWLTNNGVEKTHGLNPGGSYPFSFGRAKFVHAIHSSSFPDGTYGGIAGGFIVESADANFYYSGDTALTLDMKLFGETARLKFAILCIGGNFTMDPEDAIRAANLLQCKEVIGVHYDTFPPIKIDHAAAKEKFRAAGMTLHLLPIGGTQNF
jgi:L-ascorbate metabolism protein UlaG (beta-lactamase superfamily)